MLTFAIMQRAGRKDESPYVHRNLHHHGCSGEGTKMMQEVGLALEKQPRNHADDKTSAAAGSHGRQASVAE